MSDSGYPDFMGDTFGPLLDANRCPGVSGDRRCQLLPHEPVGMPHAHARRGEPHTARWRDDGPAWLERNPGRLRWCCLYRE